MERFVVTRTVKWGECDPAGIIYTPRALDWVTEAVEEWFRDVGGIHWMTFRNRGHGAPTVHASLDFLKPMPPNMTFDIIVLVEKVGASSLTFRVVVEDADGARYIGARFVSVIMDFGTGRAMPMPEELRQRALAYAAGGGAT